VRRSLQLLAVYGSCTLSFAQGDPPLRIAFPEPGAVVQGKVRLAVRGDAARVATVDYYLGNYRIARVSRPPFEFEWNSALAADGNSALRMAARDPLGRVVAEDEAPVWLQNYGNHAAENSGALDGVLKGTVPLSFEAFDGEAFPAYWQLFIDGEQAALRFTDQAGRHDNSLSQFLDTTRYPNGRHEIHLMVHSNNFGRRMEGDGNRNFRAMLTRTVTIDNGRTYMEPVANYLHVYLSPGGSEVDLGCMRLMTDGSREPCRAPQYASANPRVARVSADGWVAPVASGFTTITVTEDNRRSTAYVWVRDRHEIPHFLGDGRMGLDYEADSSRFLVAPIGLEPSMLRADRRLAEEVRRAGVNTLFRGIYQNVNSLNESLDQWRGGYDRAIQPDFDFARDNGYWILGAGDDICRRIGVEAYRTLNWRFGRDAVQHAVRKFVENKVAVGIEMVDEGSALWGAHPAPAGRVGERNSFQSIDCRETVCRVDWPTILLRDFHDVPSEGSPFALTGDPRLETPAGTVYRIQRLTAAGFEFTPARPVTGTFNAQTAPNLEYLWFARPDACDGAPCRPPVPNQALARIREWIKEAVSLPLSWPALGISLPHVQNNWMGTGSISDYASHFWDTNQQRVTYTWGKGIRETVNSMLTAYFDRQPFMQLDRPQLMLISGAGAAYRKGSPAGSALFDPPSDELLYAGNRPEAVAAGMMAAAAVGNAGVRIYQFETPVAHGLRRNSGPGPAFQTGIHPEVSEVANWRAMAYAAAVLRGPAARFLLGRAISSPAYGRNIVTAAREAPEGRLLMIVNGWDGPRRLRVDFRGYHLGYGYVRYRVGAAGLATDAGPPADGETVDLEAGETALYLFPAADDIVFAEQVEVAAGGGEGSRSLVRYGYLYEDALDGARFFECEDTCRVTVDRSLGDVFLQTVQLDTAGRIVEAGAVRTLDPAPPG